MLCTFFIHGVKVVFTSMLLTEERSSS